MSGYSTRDLAYERDMRIRARQQMASESDDEALEAVDHLADACDFDLGPSDEELEAYYADQDSQVAAYRA